MSFENVTNSPLSWPIGWPRFKARRTRAKFERATGQWTVFAALEETKRQLHLMGVRDWQFIVSTNLPLRRDGLPISRAAEPSDPGVALYFRLHDEPHALACDKWDRCADNLRAIALHIGAIRGQDRWGVGSMRQAFAGYGLKQLAEVGAKKPWWELLGMKEQPSSPAVVKERFHALALDHHPDRGGNANQMAEICAAYEEGLRTLGATA